MFVNSATVVSSCNSRGRRRYSVVCWSCHSVESLILIFILCGCVNFFFVITTRLLLPIWKLVGWFYTTVDIFKLDLKKNVMVTSLPLEIFSWNYCLESTKDKNIIHMTFWKVMSQKAIAEKTNLQSWDAIMRRLSNIKVFFAVLKNLNQWSYSLLAYHCSFISVKLFTHLVFDEIIHQKKSFSSPSLTNLSV